MEAPQFLKRLLGLKDPRRAASLVAKGVSQARGGDLKGALASYRAALAADDEYALAHLNVALCLQDLYNVDRTTLAGEEQDERLHQLAGHLRRAVELDARLTPGFRALGFVERALGDFEAARDAFNRYLAAAEEKDPHRERVLQTLTEVQDKAVIQEHLRVGLDVAERAAEADEPTRADAETRLTYVAEKEPQRAQALWALGVLRRTAKDLEAATRWLDAALVADPGCLPAHKELASLHFHGGNPALALPHARACYEADPTNPALTCNLGVCHLALGNLAEARELVDLARDMAPKDPIVQDAFRAVEEATRDAAGAVKK
jgi:tetratricopeptide (TPR) repeat protein